MTLQDISRLAAAETGRSEGNFIQAAWALDPALVGTRLFDAPLLGVAAADDALFPAYRRPEAVGPQSLLPEDWLPGAASVISFFLPFSAAVRESNRAPGEPSFAWLHARIEGQLFVQSLCGVIARALEAQGARAAVPMTDARFRNIQDPARGIFTSNWSERHAAYAAGLGTFGLSKGLITRRGVAGRFGSVVTTLALPPTPRDYTGLYDYCSHCMACARRCPAQAIDADCKHHGPCKEFLLGTAERYPPRYGCGKCQVGVPCEAQRPHTI